MKARRVVLGLIGMTAAVMVGCSDTERPKDATKAATELHPSVPKPVLKVASVAREALCESTETLERQVAQLVQTPSTENLQSARDAWKAAHQNWRIWSLLQQIANGGQARNAEDRIDAQPILPGYLDRVPGYPASGLTFSEVPLDPESLTAAHQSTDVYYGVLGFHPLEFMLWGVPDDEGVPTRKAEAFRDRNDASADEIPASARRRTMTASMAALLQVELTRVCPPAQPPQWMPELAARMDNGGRRQVMNEWLQELAGDMAAWRENPDGEDRNGMPLWHSAFARTDFSELNAEFEWLREHLLPEENPDKAATEALQDALRGLESQATPATSAEARFDTVAATALQLADKLSADAPRGGVKPSEQGESAEKTDQ